MNRLVTLASLALLSTVSAKDMGLSSSKALRNGNGIAKDTVLEVSSSAVPFPYPICVLYIDENVKFAFGGLNTNGNISRLIEFSTWADVMNGIDASEGNTTFFVEPGVSGVSRKRDRAVKRAIPRAPTSPKPVDGDASGTLVATVSITADKKAATVSYSNLGPIPGHTSLPDALADMNTDTVRNQIVGCVESTGSELLFVIADLAPSNGTIFKVWRDITAEWQTWNWMKYGVSCFDSVNQIYFLVVGVNNVETVLGFPLNSTTTTVTYSMPSGYDIFSVQWSDSFGGPVVMANDRNKNTITYLAWKSSQNTFVPVFSYPTNTVTSLELGQTEISTDGTIAVSSLQSLTTNQFLISYVNLKTAKELSRYTLMNPKWLPADLSICDA